MHVNPSEVLSDVTVLNVNEFDNYYQSERSKGTALYRRVVCSAMGARVVTELNGKPHECVMLGSNNYLGFANDPYIKTYVKAAIDEFGVGVSGPPLLNGHTALHRKLEKRLAALKGTEDAVLFPSGYQANLGIVDTCMKSGDILIYDELSHASFIDGIKLVRATRRIKSFHFKHNDLNELELRLQAAQQKRTSSTQIFVAVEGVYSMDGDLCPLPQVVSLCEQYDAQLIIDDAHGTGVLGEEGRGTCEHFGMHNKAFFVMGTFSKAFSVTGGFVCGPREWINYMRYFSRAYMFSAHLPIPTIAAVLAGLDLIEKEPERRKKCLSNALKMKSGLNDAGFKVKSSTPIIPILVPEGIAIRAVNRRLFEEGLFVNTVEYPAVSLSTQRLRVSVSSAHSEADIEQSVDVLTRVFSEFEMVYLQ